MADQQGTGKHPHKSTEEPYPHNRSGKSSENRSDNRMESRSEDSESRDLKEREYRDSQGNIHHHTRTSKDQKKSA